MISPCRKNCLIFPVCKNKELFKRIAECDTLRQHMEIRIIKRTETGKISTPAYITVDEEVFEVTNYPDTYTKGKPHVEYRVGVGLTRPEEHGSHVTIGYVSAYKKITTDWPVVIIKL